MTPGLRHEAGERQAEISRLYALADRALGRELLLLARRARGAAQSGDTAVRTDDDRSEVRLFRDCVPEIAARLGETLFLGTERAGGVRNLSGLDLRTLTARLLVAHYRAGPRGEDVGDLRIARAVLANEPRDGNPLAFALDRFAQADIHAPDAMALDVYWVAEARGHYAAYEWRPEFNEVPIDDPDYFAAPEVRL